MEPELRAPSARFIAIRVIAAVAVVAAAILLKETILTERVEALNLFEAKVKQIDIESELIGEELPIQVVVPEGAQRGRRSLVVFLHERGGDENSHLGEDLLRALDRAGAKAPIVAFPRGGPDSYWHDRSDGMWGSYLLEEVVPRLRGRLDVKPGRVLLAGISMGGYGAYNLARQRPDEFCAVAGHSPALWETSGVTAPGAFDDGDDFAENDVIAAISSGTALDGKRTWLDAGTEDPFIEADRALLSALDQSGARTARRLDWPGGHETSYWEGNWGAYVGFYSRALTECAEEDKAAKSGASKAEGEAGNETPAD